MSISNDQIYETLLDMKKDLGGLLATSEQHRRVFDEHVLSDKELEARVADIDLRLAQQRGTIKTWGFIASGLAAAGGTLAAFAHSLFR